MCYVAEFDLSFSLAQILPISKETNERVESLSLYFVLGSHLNLKVREKDGRCEEL